MLQQSTSKITPAALVILFSLFAPALRAEVTESVFNVKTYGATGKKADNAEPAIQKAIDACAKAGGGTVYLPPGDYTSGTLRLRSHVRFYVRSEEHTSELQSLAYLVCRLLLEKKKQN